MVEERYKIYVGGNKNLYMELLRLFRLYGFVWRSTNDEVIPGQGGGKRHHSYLFLRIQETTKILSHSSKEDTFQNFAGKDITPYHLLNGQDNG